jgi:hypothetical protein
MKSPDFPNRSRAGGSWSSQPVPDPDGHETLADEGNNGDAFLPKPAVALANSALCRAKRKKAGGFVYCLVPNAYACPFGERLDYDLLCCHPERENIIIRTEAKRRE